MSRYLRNLPIFYLDSVEYKMNNIELVQIFTTGKNESWFDECRIIVKDICDTIDLARLESIYSDIYDIFHGRYSGICESTAKYHDFHHTCAASLGATRLFHGLFIDGYSIPCETVEQGIISALFHDIGWLPTAKEEIPATIDDHEERSISFMTEYLIGKGFAVEYCDICANMIRCTNLAVDPGILRFSQESKRLGGYVVGTADLLSQMADRCYLERLPFLFEEHGYSSQFQYNTPIELFQKTADFHSRTVMERLEVTFENVHKSMRSHFRERWGLDKDLYDENIMKNLNYLEMIVEECKGDFSCLKKRLRRTIKPS